MRAQEARSLHPKADQNLRLERQAPSLHLAIPRQSQGLPALPGGPWLVLNRVSQVPLPPAGPFSSIVLASVQWPVVTVFLRLPRPLACRNPL